MNEQDQNSRQNEFADSINNNLNQNTVKKKNIKDFKIILIIDSREKKNSKDLNFFQKSLKDYYKIECEITPLQIGDFLWICEILDTDDIKQWYILDYIIERKAGDDLAHSLMDKRYKDQQYRLHQTNIKHIIYLIEGQTTGSTNVSASTIESAILSTQTNQNFKIKRTTNSQDTAKYISLLHSYIAKFWKNKIDSLDWETGELKFSYTYTEFDKFNKKSNITLKSQFGQMLRNISKSGPEFVSQFLKLYDTPLKFITEINELKAPFKYQVEYLLRKVKEHSKKAPSKALIENIVRLFCDNQYQNTSSNLIIEEQ